MKNTNGIFIYGYFGYNNFGDDLLIRSVIEAVNKYDSNAGFYIKNYGDIVSINELYADIKLTNIEKILSDRHRNKFNRLLRYLNKYWDIFKECKLFIIGGGTLIHDNTYISNLLLLCIIMIARVRGLKVIALGMGISSLNLFNRLILKLIISMCHDFCVRDIAALNECNLAGNDGKVILTEDLVYSLANTLIKPITKSKKSQKRYLGISLADRDAVNWQGDDALRDDIIRLFKRSIPILVDRGWEIVLLSYQNVNISKDKLLSDRNILSELIVSEPRGQSIKIIDVEATATSIFEVYSGLDLLIGMRFHSLMLAALYGIPFIGLSYDNKTVSLCNKHNMPVIDLVHLKEDWLLETIVATDNKNIDFNVVKQCIEDSKRNIEILSTYLGEKIT